MKQDGAGQRVQAEAASEEAGVLTVQVGRVFDVPEAWLIRDAIERAPAKTRIALDFRRTSELHDFALAVLVETFSRERHRIELRGLGRHHRGLLRLLERPVDADARPTAVK